VVAGVADRQAAISEVQGDRLVFAGEQRVDALAVGGGGLLQ